MANSTITNYLADPSIPAEKRRKIAEGLNTGKLNESTAIQGITAKYGEKYGTPSSTPTKSDPANPQPTPASGSPLAGKIVTGLMGAANPKNWGSAAIEGVKKAGTIAKNAGVQIEVTPSSTEERNKDVQYLNSKGITPDSNQSDEDVKSGATNMSIATGDFIKKPFEDAANNTLNLAKQGLITGGEGVQKVGAAITGDTSSLEGFRSFYGIKSPEQAAADMKELTPGERGQMFGEGAQNFVSGTIGTAFSPVMGATEAVPGGKMAMDALNEKVMTPVVQAGSGQLKNTLKNMGVPLTPEQEASIDEGVGNLLNLFMVKAGEDTARAKALDVQKAELSKSIPEMIAKGDLEGAKTAMAQYEKAVTEHTTATGRVSAAVGDGVAAAGSKVVKVGGETVKTVGTKVMDVIKKDPETVLNKTIDTGIQKGVRPSVTGKATAETQATYKTKAREGVKAIIENKKDLSFSDLDTGEVIKGELPQNLTQFSEAIQQAKKKVYQKYSEMTQKAGDSGVKVNLNDIANELDKIASDQVLQDSNPSAAKYAAEKAEILRNRSEYTPEQAEQALKIYNDSLQNFYRNPTPDTYAKAHVDALVANHLRTGLDNVIESLDDIGYADLKKQYGALKTIEKDVNHRAVVNSRQNQIGLIDGLTNVASAAEAINGLLHMNPQAFATGLAMKGISKYIKYLNDPNVIVKNMFSKSEKFLSKVKDVQSKTNNKVVLTEKPVNLKPAKTTPKSFSSTNPAGYKDIFSSEHGQQVYNELKNSEAGKRFATDVGENASYKSTFPKWIPENLRSKKLIEAVVDKLTNNQLISSESGKALARVIKERVDSLKPSTGDMPF